MRHIVRSALLALAMLVTARAAGAQTQLVIVSGLGGSPKYTQQFGALSTALATAASERAGLPDSAITWLGEATAPKSAWLRGTSTRENIEATLTRLARGTGEQLVLVLLGHGSGEGADTRVSLPGPDLSAADFARLLAPFRGRRVAFLNLTSGGGDMLPVLTAPGRVVMTATKSAFERNETHFARFFVDALAKEGADTDKDTRVSLLEAYTFAQAEVKRFYETEGRLATEHSQLRDDDGLAARFFLAPGAAARAGGDARLAALYAEKAALDEQIQALRARKAAMSADAYERELERLLVALATTSEEIRKRERGS